MVTVDALVGRYGDLAIDLATALVAFMVVYAVGRFVVVPVLTRIADIRKLDSTSRRALRRLFHAVVVVVATAVAVTVAGVGSAISGSAIVVAALTVALGFAAQDAIGNLASGVFIVADPQFNIGDWIEWDGNSGVIDDIGFRATRVRTFNDEIVTVPNSELTTNAVTNAVIGGRLRIVHSFAVDADADVESATTVLETVAHSHPDVLSTPGPSVRMVDVDGASVTLEARFWIGNPNRTDFVRVRSEYLRTVKERFDAVGIELSVPPTVVSTSKPADSDLADAVPDRDGS